MEQNKITWLLNLLKKSLLALDQFASCFSSSFVIFSIVIISLLAYESFVSLKKWWTKAWCNGMHL